MFNHKIFLLSFIATLFFACNNNQTKDVEHVVIKDMLGRSVSIPQKIKKVVGVKPGALRMLSYLNAKEMIVGVEYVETQNHNPYNFANPEYKNLPVIGPMHGGDAELITIIQPDVIFMTYSTEDDANKLQNQTGIPVIALQYGDLSKNKEQFYSSLKLMAKVINKTQRADSLISYIENTITDLNNRTQKVASELNSKIYIGGISMKGKHGISSTSPDYTPFKYLNVKNLAYEYKSSNNNTFIDKEQIVKWNPDKIFVDYSGWDIVQEDLKQEALAQTLKAVKNNEVYLVLPYNWYTTNYATVLLNSYFIGNVLFPDEFADIDFEQKSDEIYKAFLGVGVYQDMKSYFTEPKQVIFNN